MARTKTRIQYTLKDYPGTIIEVESTKDDEKARDLALQEILKRVDDENENTFNSESFADGLSVDDLIFVEQTKNNDRKIASGERELEPLELAAKEIAQFALLRITLQESQGVTKKYLSAIEALFQPTPLTSEQIEIFQTKEFTKKLEILANAKVEYDRFLPQAEIAWQLLKPLILGDTPDSVVSQVDTNSNVKTKLSINN